MAPRVRFRGLDGKNRTEMFNEFVAPNAVKRENLTEAMWDAFEQVSDIESNYMVCVDKEIEIIDTSSGFDLNAVSEILMSRFNITERSNLNDRLSGRKKEEK